MKILASLLVLGLIGFVSPVFAESPTVSSTGDIVTATLLTPEFEVDTTEFSETGEIIIDVKFENPGSQRHGITWNFESAYDENGLDDPVEVYERYESQRMFYIYILDEDGKKLNIESLTVTSNDDFILPHHGITEKYDDRYVVEVLDIDEYAPFTSSGKAKIETTLRLSSHELIAEKNYELGVTTETRYGHDPLSFTLPAIQETITPEPTPSKIIPTEEPVKEIPNWVKDIFKFYSSGSIGDSELVGALQYLIKEGIIKV